MAKGPGAQRSTGKVSVTVVPDTAKFPAELKAKLEKLERDLRIQIQVDVGLTTAKAEAEMQALRQRLETKAVNLGVKLDTSGVGRLNRSLSKATRSTLGLGAPLILIGRGFDAAARSVDRVTDGLVRARAAMASMVGQTAVWVAQMVRLAVSVDTARTAWTRLSQAVLAVSAAAQRIPRLASLARDLAMSLGRALGDGTAWSRRFYNGMFDVYTVLGSVERGVRRVGSGLRALGDPQFWARSFYSAMFDVYSVLGRVEAGFKRLRNIRLRDVVDGVRRLGSGLAGVARSAATAGRSIARGIGRGFDAGIKGVGKTISSVLSGLGGLFKKVGGAVSGFGESLMNMSRTGWIAVAVLAVIAPLVGLVAAAIAALPSTIALFGAGIAAVALGMDGIKAAAEVAGPALDLLKASVSEVFTRDLTPVFARIANVLLPGITAGMRGVAEGVSTVAGAFVDVVTSAEGIAQVNTILENTKAFLVGLAPFVREFTAGFLTLAEVGSARFAGLAASMGEWARQFTEVINTAAKTGVLDSALQGLGQVLGSVARAFTALFESGLTAMGQLGGPLSSLIDGIADLAVALMPILTAISSSMAGDLLGQELGELAKIATALQPSLKLLVESFAELAGGAIAGAAPIVLALAKILNDILLAALKAIQPILPKLTEFFTKLGESVGNSLLDAFTELSPLIDLIAGFLGDLLESVTPLLPSLNELASAALTGLLDILTPLVPPLIDLARVAFPLVTDAVKLLIPFVKFAIDIFSGLTAETGKFVSGAIEELIPVFKTILEVVQDVWPSIKEIISGALEFVKGLFNLVMGIITLDWSRAWEGIQQIGSGILDGIVGAVKGWGTLVVDLVTKIPEAIGEAFLGIGELLFDSGRRLIEGFIEGIKSMAQSAKNAASNLVSTVRNFFPFSPAKTGPFSGTGYTLYSGRALVEDWAKGIEDKAPMATRAIEGLMSGSNVSATAEWNGHITSDQFGGVGDQISEALAGWTVEIDANGIARMVNKSNRMNARR